MKLAKLKDGPEIFFSVQGEGRSLGRPSIFVRLSMCNLYCIWCDTDYAWNWEGTPFRHVKDQDKNYQKYNQAKQMIELSISEVCQKIENWPCKDLIFTGGEPMLHKDGYAKLTQAYDDRGNITEQAYFGTDGEPILSKKGYARITWSYDDAGNRNKTVRYNLDGEEVKSGE